MHTLMGSGATSTNAETPTTVENNQVDSGLDVSHRRGLSGLKSAVKREHHSRENIDRMMADIESALLYLEEDRRHRLEYPDKRILRLSAGRGRGRRQHNFVRIGKRRDGTDSGHNFWQDIAARLRSKASSSGDGSTFSVDQGLHSDSPGRNEVELSVSDDILSFNLINRYISDLWSTKASHTETSGYGLKQNREYQNDASAVETRSNDKRGNRFVRIGRGESRLDSAPQMPQGNDGHSYLPSLELHPLPYHSDTVEFKESPLKRRAHKFIRFGRSFRPHLQEEVGKSLLQSPDFNDKFLSSTDVDQLPSETDAEVSPIKRGRFNKFVRIGRSTHPYKISKDLKLSRRSPELLTNPPASDSSTDVGPFRKASSMSHANRDLDGRVPHTTQTNQVSKEFPLHPTQNMSESPLHKSHANSTRPSSGVISSHKQKK